MAPASGDALFFGAGATTTVSNDLLNYSFAGITFIAGASAFTITGNTFSLSAGITNIGTNQETFNNTGGLSVSASSETFTVNSGGGNVTVSNGLSNTNAGGQTLTVNGPGGLLTLGGYVLEANGTTAATDTINGNGNVTISGAVTNGTATGGLTYNGSGVLTLSGTNTYTGPTTVSGGTVILSGSSSSAGVTTVNSGGTYNVIGSLTGATAITVNVGGSFSEQNSVTNLGSGVIGVAGSTLTVNGGVALLDGINNYTGATVVTGSSLASSGFLVLDFSSTLNSSANNIINPASALTLGFGGLEMLGNNTNNATNNQTFASTTFTTLTASTISLLQGSGTGTTLNLNLGALTRGAYATTDIAPPTTGAITTTSTTASSNGILVSAATGGVAFATANNETTWATNNSGTIGALATYNTGNAAYTASTPGNIDVGAGANGTTDAPTAAFTVNTLRFNAMGLALTAPTGLNTISTGGILVTSGSSGTITGGSLEAGAGRELVIINNTGTLNIGSVIQDNAAGPSALTLSGGLYGVTELSGANTFSGQTTVQSGTLDLANSFALQNSALLNNGTLTFDQVVTSNAFSVGGITGSGGIVLSNNAPTPVGVALTVGANNTSTTYTGVLSGLGSLIKAGTGTLTLNAVNTYVGGTSIQAGTLTIANASALGTGPVSLGASSGAANAILEYSAGGGITALANPVSVNAGSTGTQEILAFSGAPNFTAPVTLNNSLLLSNTNTAAGNILTLSGGISGTGNVTVTNTSVSPTTISGGTVNFAGTLSNTSNSSGGLIVSANLSGVESIVQNSAASTTTLSGTNTNMGATTVTAGALEYQVASALTPNATTTVGPAGSLILGVGGTTGFTSANVDALFANTLANVRLNGATRIGLDTTPGSFTYGTSQSTGRLITELGANTLTLTGTDTFLDGIVVSAGTLQLGDGTASHDTQLGSTPAVVDNAAVSFDTSAAQSYVGTIGGSGTLTKLGAGTLTLSGTNFFTGATTVSAGTLNLSNAQALQNSVLQSGGTGLVFSSSVASHAFAVGGLNGTTALALTDNGGNAVALTLSPLNGVAATYNSALTGGGSLTIAGVGTETLGGTNNYAGGTTISLGTLKLDFTQTGAPASNILYSGSSSPGMLTMGGIGSATNASGIPGATLIVNGKSGATSSQSFGGLTINPGVSNIQITPNGTGGAVQLNFTNGLTHNAGGVINFTDTQSTTNFISLGNGTTVGTVNDVTGIIGGYATVNGTAYASVNTSGQVVPYTYTTTVGTAGAIVDSGTGTETNVELTGAASTATLSGTSNGATNINTLTNAGTGAQVVTIGSGNTLRLGVNGGILENATTNQALTIGTANVGTLTAGGNAYGTAGEISIIGRSSGTITINSVIANNNTSTGAANSTGGGAVTLTVGSTQSSTTRNITIAGNNTYSGGTYLNGSEVQANSTTAFGTGAVNILPGSQVSLNAGGNYANTFNIAGIGANEGGYAGALRFGAGTISGTVNLMGDSSAVFQGSGIISGSLSGTGSFNVFGNGDTLTFGSATSTDTITGNFDINGFAPGVPTSGNAFTVKLAGPNTLPNALANTASTGNVIINGPSVASGTNSVLDLNGNSVATNGLVAAGANVASAVITNSGAANVTLTIGDNNSNASFGGMITDGGANKTLSIIKAGTGTQNFSGPNTYNGMTSVNAGTLLYNGSLTPTVAGGSTVVVGSTATPAVSATLGGTGILTVTSVTVNTNGVLVPGATVGATTGALTLNTTSGLTINGTLAIGIAGSGSTSLATNGVLTLGSGSILTVTGMANGTSDYDVANYGSLTTGSAFATTSGIPSGYKINYDGSTFSTADIELDPITTVPEPSTWQVCGLVFLGGVAGKFRRRCARK